MDYYNVTILKNTLVDKYEDGIVYAEENVKNYSNSAGRAPSVAMPGPCKNMHKIQADNVVVYCGYISLRLNRKSIVKYKMKQIKMISLIKINLPDLSL